MRLDIAGAIEARDAGEGILICYPSRNVRQQIRTGIDAETGSHSLQLDQRHHGHAGRSAVTIEVECPMMIFDFGYYTLLTLGHRHLRRLTRNRRVADVAGTISRTINSA